MPSERVRAGDGRQAVRARRRLRDWLGHANVSTTRLYDRHQRRRFPGERRLQKPIAHLMLNWHATRGPVARKCAGQWLRVRRRPGWSGTRRPSWPMPTGSTATSIVIACRVDQHSSTPRRAGSAVCGTSSSGACSITPPLLNTWLPASRQAILRLADSPAEPCSSGSIRGVAAYRLPGEPESGRESGEVLDERVE